MSDVTAVPLRPIKKGSLLRLWLGIALVALLGIGIGYAGTSKQVAMAEPASAFLARNKTADGVQTTASGLQYKILEQGTGVTAKPTDIALVEFEGRLADGKVFGSTAATGNPVPFAVNQLIPGWSEGLQLMNAGSKFRFWISPELGYGSTGAGDGVIPPDALLVFDVKLLALAPQEAGMGAPGGQAAIGQ